jgi:hypothetical protein
MEETNWWARVVIRNIHIESMLEYYSQPPGGHKLKIHSIKCWVGRGATGTLSHYWQQYRWVQPL